MKKILKSLLFCSIASTAYSKFMDVEVAASMTPGSSARSVVMSDNLNESTNVEGFSIRRNPILDKSIGFAFRVSTNFYVTEHNLFGISTGYHLDSSKPQMAFFQNQLAKSDIRLHFFPIMANYKFDFFSKENVNFYLTVRAGIAFGGLLKKVDDAIRKEMLPIAKNTTNNRKTSSISRIMEAGIGCEVSGFQAEAGYRLMIINLLTADLKDVSGMEADGSGVDKSNKSPLRFLMMSNSFYVSVGYRLTF